MTMASILSLLIEAPPSCSGRNLEPLSRRHARTLLPVSVGLTSRNYMTANCRNMSISCKSTPSDRRNGTSIEASDEEQEGCSVEDESVWTKFVAETLLPTTQGKFRLRGYRHTVGSLSPRCLPPAAPPILTAHLKLVFASPLAD